MTSGRAVQAKAPPLLEDAALLERCRQGDTAAFGPLIVKYQDRVYNSILRLCGNCDDAEELCQDTFVKALENLLAFRQASGFYTWLFRIAVNLTISRRRRASRVRFHSLEGDNGDDHDARGDRPSGDARQDDPRELALAGDSRRQVVKALVELDEEFSAVVVLRDIEDMNYEQIAQVLEVPVGTVKSRLYRARALLREKLQDVAP
jgi:RNA polymerase sigma-70 factor (ECF subfamily)